MPEFWIDREPGWGLSFPEFWRWEDDHGCRGWSLAISLIFVRIGMSMQRNSRDDITKENEA